jgi:hypothetical protein
VFVRVLMYARGWKLFLGHDTAKFCIFSLSALGEMTRVVFAYWTLSHIGKLHTFFNATARGSQCPNVKTENVLSSNAHDV